jgi:hypothetical protein
MSLYDKVTNEIKDHEDLDQYARLGKYKAGVHSMPFRTDLQARLNLVSLRTYFIGTAKLVYGAVRIGKGDKTAWLYDRTPEKVAAGSPFSVDGTKFEVRCWLTDDTETYVYDVVDQVMLLTAELGGLEMHYKAFSFIKRKTYAQLEERGLRYERVSPERHAEIEAILELHDKSRVAALMHDDMDDESFASMTLAKEHSKTRHRRGSSTEVVLDGKKAV